MTAERTGVPEWFRDLADIHGGEIDRWPAARRGAARTLLRQSGEARALIDEAVGLDALLSLAPPADASPALMAEILADSPAPGWRGLLGLLWPGAPAWKPASALCAAAVLGLGLGATSAGAPSAEEVALAYEFDTLAYGDAFADGEL